MVNGTSGSPGVLRIEPGGAGAAGAWVDLTNIVSTNRSPSNPNMGSPNITTNDPTYGQAVFGAPPYAGSLPNTPGPDDNYQINFPQTNAAWTSLAMNGGTLYAALGTAAGSFVGKGAFLNDNGVYRLANAANATTANNTQWLVGDPNYNPDNSNPAVYWTNPPTYPFAQDNESPNAYPVGGGNIKIGISNQGITISGTFYGGPTIYASVANTSGGFQEIYVSGDGGVDWFSMSAVASDPSPAYLDAKGGGQDGGQYNNAIWVNPNNSTNLYVAGQVNDTATDAGQIYEMNGLGAWTDLSADAGYGPLTAQHAIAVSGNNVFFGGDGGLWQFNSGTTTWTNINGNLDISQINSVATNPTNPSDILAGANMNGTLVTTNDGLTWVDGNNPAVQDGGEVEFSTATNSGQTQPIAYAAGITPSFGGANMFLYKSTQGGAAGTWTSILTVASGPTGAQPYPSTFPFVVDPANPSRIVVGGANFVDETLNGGTSWINRGSGLPGTQVTNLAIATYQGTYVADSRFPTSGIGAVSDLGSNTYDPNTIYVTDGTNIYVTKDDGLKWVDAATGTAIGGLGDIVQLVVDPRNRDTVYAVRSAFGNAQVFETTDAGQTWVNISNNLPSAPAWSLVLDPRTGSLYVGDDVGVFQSINGGTSWTRLGNGLPAVQVKTMELNQNTNILTIGTDGRGVYQYSLDAAPGTQQVITLNNATPGTTTFTLTFNGKTTSAITYNGSANNGVVGTDDAYDIETALNGLSSITSTGGYVTVSPNSTDTAFTVTFIGGTLAGTALPITGTVTSTDGATVTVPVNNEGA